MAEMEPVPETFYFIMDSVQHVREMKLTVVRE